MLIPSSRGNQGRLPRGGFGADLISAARVGRDKGSKAQVQQVVVQVRQGPWELVCHPG